MTDQELTQFYYESVRDHIDEKGIWPTPALARLVDDSLEFYAMAVDKPDIIIGYAIKNALRPEVTEQIVALDTYCLPNQGTTLDSCLIVFHMRRGQPARVGVLEYSWNDGEPITKDIAWDNPFWPQKYQPLATKLTIAFLPHSKEAA